MDLLADLEIPTELAPKRLRIFAALIDFVILVILFEILGRLWGQHGTVADTSSGYSYKLELTGIPALLFFLISFGLIPIMEGITGKTIGKRILKIKVVKEDYTDTTLGSSIARHLFDAVDWFCLVGLIVASTNKKKQRIGDLVAKTIVIKDK